MDANKINYRLGDPPCVPLGIAPRRPASHLWRSRRGAADRRRTASCSDGCSIASRIVGMPSSFGGRGCVTKAVCGRVRLWSMSSCNWMVFLVCNSVHLRSCEYPALGLSLLPDSRWEPSVTTYIPGRAAIEGNPKVNMDLVLEMKMAK